jgi:Spy/CpxP family protein refolding chaperone
MRRIIFTLTIVSCVFLSNNCFAQTTPLPTPSNSPQQEEKTIFSFKKEIGLSDEQENKIKVLLFDGENLMKSYRRDLNTLGEELARMINKDEDMSLIKSKLTEISKIQVEVSCYNVESARKVRGILSPEQLKTWEDIKKANAKK